MVQLPRQESGILRVKTMKVPFLLLLQSAGMLSDCNPHAQAASLEHHWVLCVDDDVLLYETFLEDLIRSMQQHPAAFMATGLPGPCCSAHACSRHL